MQQMPMSVLSFVISRHPKTRRLSYLNSLHAVITEGREIEEDIRKIGVRRECIIERVEQLLELGEVYYNFKESIPLKLFEEMNDLIRQVENIEQNLDAYLNRCSRCIQQYQLMIN